MVILAGANQHGNMLHVVLGPESGFWMDLHGAMVSNITNVLNGLNASLPVYLHVSRCDSEETLSAELNAQTQQGEVYPFQITTNVFVPTHKGSQSPVVKPAAVPSPNAKNAQPPPATPHLIMKIGKCERCGHSKKELVPKVTPAMCYDCLHLDLMLAASRRTEPTAPPETQHEQPSNSDIPPSLGE